MKNGAIQDNEAIVFVNVNVIPMVKERVLEDQSAIVRGDRIVEIGSADEIIVPSGAQVIEGNGAYLMPGLVDMHEHIGNNQDALTLFLANGVTTIRNFNSEAPILTLRDRVAAGDLLGPTISPGRQIFGIPPVYASIFDRFDKAVGPMFELNVPGLFSTAAGNAVDGREVVLKAKEDGYEFIKINWYLTRETFDSIASTAAEVGLPLYGHIPADVGVEHFIRSGAHPEHDYQLLSYVAKDYVRGLGPNPLDFFDLSDVDEKLPKLVTLMTEEGAVFDPTMVVYETFNEMFDYIDDLPQASLFQKPEYRYVPPEYMREWTNSANEEFQAVMRDRGVSDIQEIIPDPAYRDEVMAFSKRLVKALHKGGVPILAGSDSSDPGVVWGFSIHRELELLTEAGLTPFQALEAATRIPAELVFGNPEEWGTAEVGKRADLLLLSANPLEDVCHTRQIAGVMVRGRWLSMVQLQGMLDELAAKYEVQRRNASNFSQQDYGR